MIGFDMKTKLPQQNVGLFGIPQAFMGGIESQVKGTLHVHIAVFLAGFPRDTRTTVDRLSKDSCLISFSKSVIYSSALENEKRYLCPKCRNSNTFVPVKINKHAYTRHEKRSDPYNTSICTHCESGFGRDYIFYETQR